MEIKQKDPLIWFNITSDANAVLYPTINQNEIECVQLACGSVKVGVKSQTLTEIVLLLLYYELGTNRFGFVTMKYTWSSHKALGSISVSVTANLPLP